MKERFNMRMSPSLRAAIYQKAKALGVSVTDFACVAFWDAVDKYEAESPDMFDMALGAMRRRVKE